MLFLLAVALTLGFRRSGFPSGIMRLNWQVGGFYFCVVSIKVHPPFLAMGETVVEENMKSGRFRIHVLCFMVLFPGILIENLGLSLCKIKLYSVG